METVVRRPQSLHFPEIFLSAGIFKLHKSCLNCYEKSIAYLCFKNFKYGPGERIKKKELIKSCVVPDYLHYVDVVNNIFIYE
jgi:hypothetical protein